MQDSRRLVWGKTKKTTAVLIVTLGFVFVGAGCQKKSSSIDYNDVVRPTLNFNINASTTNTTVSTNSTSVNLNTNTSIATNTSINTNTTPPSAHVLPVSQRVSDASSTLSSPVNVSMTDGRGYFIVGQPKGQNSKATKKIIFSLPGHDTTAETDYNAWKSQITDNDYALASVNWWDGSGETPNDYLKPEEVMTEITTYLTEQGYDAADFVVLEGFSRGSANTYPTKAVDVLNGTNVVDAVISASGKYQSDFSITASATSRPNLFAGTAWILACGGKDDNPTRDGCPGMTETKTWLTSEGANVLGLLEDPNGAHGAFHASPLKLVDQALALLDALPAAK